MSVDALLWGSGGPFNQTRWQSRSQVPSMVTIPKMGRAASKSSQESSKPAVPWICSL